MKFVFGAPSTAGNIVGLLAEAGKHYYLTTYAVRSQLPASVALMLQSRLLPLRLWLSQLCKYPQVAIDGMSQGCWTCSFVISKLCIVGGELSFEFSKNKRVTAPQPESYIQA